ncbi:hypothetical protein [Streptomyces sp. NPDC000880]
MFRTTRCAAMSAAIVATGALLLSGCSSSSAGTSAEAAPSASASGGAQQMDAYRQCLSEQGVTLPSGRPSGRPSGGAGGGGAGGGGRAGGGGGGFGGGQSADPEFQKAQEACASLRPQGGGGGNADASAISAFTSCMKDHGVVLPSASPGSQGNPVSGLNTADAKTAEAYTSCQALLPQRPSGQPAATPSASS